MTGPPPYGAPDGAEQSDADRVLARARALRDLGRPAEALRAAQRGLAADPHDCGLRLTAASLALELSDYALAREHAAAAAQLAPGWSLPLSLLAQARRLSGDARGGEQAAWDALKLDPDDTLALFEAGVAAAVQSQKAPPWRRRALSERARGLAERVAALEPQEAGGPALLALVSAAEGRWPQHRAEIALALAREPDDPFAHAVRLLGLQAQRPGEVMDALWARLRDQPNDAYARRALRTEFSFGRWWKMTWGKEWWIAPLACFTWLLPVFVLSLPLYFVWRARRVRRYAALYAAVFTPGERRRRRVAHLVCLSPPLLLGALLLADAVVPTLFAGPGAIFGAVWLLSALLVVAFTLPAALTGRGGFFGRSPDEVGRPAPPAPRPLTLSSLLSALIRSGLTLLLGQVCLNLLWAFFGSGEAMSSETATGLAVLTLLSSVLAAAGPLHRARYGEDAPTRFSLSDGMLALFTLLVMVLFGGDVLR